MSLLSSNIKKTRYKLSLKDAKIAPEERELTTAEPVKEIERPITKEDEDYTKLLEKNPALEKLVDAFGLVGKNSGRKLNKASQETTGDLNKDAEVKAEAQYTETPKKPAEPLKKPQSFSKLFSLAHQVLHEGDSISREEIIERLQEQTKVNQERAVKGFNMMLEEDIIIQVNQLNKYYLNGSTPF